jgi:hypothetical protein
MKPTVLESAHDFAVGRWRRVALYHWRGETTVAAARLLQRAVSDLCTAPDDAPVLVFGLVSEGAPPPSTEVRGALADGMRAGSGRVRASAVVMEGRGFRASVGRGIATGLTLLARPSFPHRVHADVGEAAGWLASLAPAYEAEDLAAALEALRRAP